MNCIYLFILIFLYLCIYVYDYIDNHNTDNDVTV
jgi:hypothetical protein